MATETIVNDDQPAFPENMRKSLKSILPLIQTPYLNRRKLHTFMNACERVADAHRPNPANRFQHANNAALQRLFLTQIFAGRDDAQTWLAKPSTDAATLPDWAALRADLFKHVCPPHDATAKKREVEESRQQPHEPLPVYRDRFRQDLQDFLDRDPTDEDEATAMPYFIKGLDSVTMRQAAMTAPPTANLDQMCDYVHRAVTRQEVMGAQSSSRRGGINFTHQREEDEDVKTMVKDAVQAAVKAMSKEVQALRAQNAEILQALKSAPATTPAPPQSFNFNRPAFCPECKRSDHFSPRFHRCPSTHDPDGNWLSEEIKRRWERPRPNGHGQAASPSTT